MKWVQRIESINGAIGVSKVWTVSWIKVDLPDAAGGVTTVERRVCIH
jgi:hypothetical protein